MRTQRAEELRIEWAGKPCSHPHLEKEYSQGWPTGNVVCSTCGHVATAQEDRQLVAAA